MPNILEHAEIVPPAHDEPKSVPPLVVPGKRKNKLFIVLLIVAVVAAIGVAYPFFVGSTASTDVGDQQAEAKVDTPAAGLTACQGDLSQASEQRRWYCQGFRPWKERVDARLDERTHGGSTTLWIIIMALGASNILSWIVLVRHRHSSS